MLFSTFYKYLYGISFFLYKIRRLFKGKLQKSNEIKGFLL